jgi:nucleotide-binding universal stress UspA family protein
MEASMPVIKRILCPVDFSDTAVVGAREAASLARSAGAELLLLHVLDEPWLASANEGGYGAPIAQQYEMIARHKLSAAADAVSPLTHVRVLLVRGEIDEAIAKAASTHGADLIVMGTRARKGLARLLADSMTERVMRLAKVPVVRVCPRVPRRPTSSGMIARHGAA